MKPLTLLLPFFLPFLALSNPTPGYDPSHEWSNLPCLSDHNASFLVSIMVSLSVAFDPSYVTQFITDDFTLQSDSINWALGLPSGVTTFDNKDLVLEGAFNATKAAKQPEIDVSLILHSCTDIAFRANQVGVKYPVQGIHILRTRNEGGVWKVWQSLDEVNSAEDAYAHGVLGCKWPGT